MERIKKIQAYINAVIAEYPDAGQRWWAYAHTYGTAQLCALLAIKRGLDAELANIIGLLHDVYRYKVGDDVAFHAVNGSEMTRVLFKNELTGLFLIEEQTAIISAIFYHSDKDAVHGAYDELLKDCDALQTWLYDLKPSRLVGWGKRIAATAAELGVTVELPEQQSEMVFPHTSKFTRAALAEIAGRLTDTSITGERSDAEFMRIIRYFPEQSAFDELVNAWCAAFVFHCCEEAGLYLPIRAAAAPGETEPLRFACVLGWVQWAEKRGFCFCEKDGFVPDAGDIVIYNNIIPHEHKPKSDTWCDHIGVVLSCGGELLTVAEGNVGNLNVSGIVSRIRDDTIGCYIRIPDGYVYR